MIYSGTFDAYETESSSSTFNGVALDTRSIPAGQADRGGDWCETFPVSRDAIALSIGDVCGHGLESFATMAMLRGAIRDGVRRGLDPAQTLAEASGLLAKTEPDVYATGILALLDTRRSVVTFANAGHPPPIVAGAESFHFLEFSKSDAPLGWSADLPELHNAIVPAEALLVFYTDGVTERTRDLSSGESQLRDAVRFAMQCPQLPSASVIERQMFLRGSNPDDVAILTARMPRFASAPASALLAVHQA